MILILILSKLNLISTGSQGIVKLVGLRRGILSFEQSKNILEQMGLRISRTDFYNLQKKQELGYTLD